MDGPCEESKNVEKLDERTKIAIAGPVQSHESVAASVFERVVAEHLVRFPSGRYPCQKSRLNGSLFWIVSLSTDIGLKRSNNQDSHGVLLAHDMDDWRERGHLLIVADGMGAHAAGELASKLAVDHVSHLYRKHRELSPPEAMRAALDEANNEINRRGMANLSFHRMGTTCSSLLLLPQGAVAAHVGDSRVYLCRDGHLRQITFDHSLVWEMREAGIGGEANKNIPRNVITRSLGPELNIKIDLEGPFPVEQGDTFLLCSDGLTGLVLDEELAPALTYLTPAVASELLKNMALIRGGHDNITTIVARIVSSELTSRASRSAPLVVGESNEPQKPVHLGLWVALGVLLLVSGTLFAVGETMYAWIAIAAAMVPGLAILSQVLGLFREGGISLSSGRMLGKAPYTDTPAQSAAEFARHLLAFLGEARNTAKSKEWQVDWNELDTGLSRAKAEYEAEDTETAFDHLVAVSGQLAEACRQRAKQAAQS